jgi:hypothetical protein
MDCDRCARPERGDRHLALDFVRLQSRDTGMTATERRVRPPKRGRPLGHVTDGSAGLKQVPALLDQVPLLKGFDQVAIQALMVLLAVGKQAHENQSRQDTSATMFFTMAATPWVSAVGDRAAKIDFTPAGVQSKRAAFEEDRGGVCSLPGTISALPRCGSTWGTEELRL